MRTYFRAYLMCHSMFCALPIPQIWDEKAKDKMLPFLPIIGLEIGLIWAFLAWGCHSLLLPPMVTGLILCAFPYVITGFLHLDGFMDVTDAVRSWRDTERQRQILKDSRVGSFAVIGLVLLILGQFTFFVSASETSNFHILILIPAVSRCCSALAVTCLKPMSSSQYADRRKSTCHMVLLVIMLSVFITIGFLLWKKYVFTLIGCVIGYGLALTRAYRSLKGMNGDISGYALSIGELWAVAIFSLL